MFIIEKLEKGGKAGSMVDEFWLEQFLSLSYITPVHNCTQVEMCV